MVRMSRVKTLSSEGILLLQSNFVSSPVGWMRMYIAKDDRLLKEGLLSISRYLSLYVNLKWPDFSETREHSSNIYSFSNYFMSRKH